MVLYFCTNNLPDLCYLWCVACLLDIVQCSTSTLSWLVHCSIDEHGHVEGIFVSLITWMLVLTSLPLCRQTFHFAHVHSLAPTSLKLCLHQLVDMEAGGLPWATLVCPFTVILAGLKSVISIIDGWVVILFMVDLQVMILGASLYWYKLIYFAYQII